MKCETNFDCFFSIASLSYVPLMLCFSHTPPNNRIIGCPNESGINHTEICFFNNVSLAEWLYQWLASLICHLRSYIQNNNNNSSMHFVLFEAASDQQPGWQRSGTSIKRRDTDDLCANIALLAFSLSLSLSVVCMSRGDTMPHPASAHFFFLRPQWLYPKIRNSHRIVPNLPNYDY